MLQEIITLSEERNVTLTVYRLEHSAEYQQEVTRPMVIVCPGGGYCFLSDREGDPVALRYLAAGFHAAVLRYGIGEYAVAPGPLHDIAAAVEYIRKKSDVWYIDPEQIYVAGFSAGAHVACQLGVFWNDPDLLPEYEGRFQEIRPNGMILGYPVIDLTKTDRHMDIGLSPDADLSSVDFGQKHPKMPLSKIFVYDPTEGRCFVDFEAAMNAYLFDGEYTPEQEERYCLQKWVTKDTCPAFIWHCADDGLILPDNSLELAAALSREKIPVELHLYSGGAHGISLSDYVTAQDPCQYYPYAANWMQHSVNWILMQSGYVEEIKEKAGVQ